MLAVDNLLQKKTNAPDVKLVDVTDVPFDLSIATARTCYSSKGIITPEDVSSTPEARALRDKIAKSTLQAGHLTTRQHVHFVFAIDNVSRHLVWSFLHSHPFYNSEQVSQRYVEVKPDRFYIPDSLLVSGKERLLAFYLDAVKFAVGVYQELLHDLDAPAEREFYKIFPARKSRPDFWKKNIHKKSMEAARYILPVSMHTYFYHTINGLTLHRYRRLCLACDVPEEARTLIEAMFEAVCAVDPLFAAEIPDPVPLAETPEYKFFAAISASAQESLPSDFIREFDLDLGNRTSRLVSYDQNAPQVLAGAVRAVLGATRAVLTDDAAVDLVLSPAQNSHLSSSLNETTLSRITRSLLNVHYTFQKKISHTADSQDQRHRLVPGSRPVLIKQFSGRPDFITPALISAHEPSAQKYVEAMSSLFEKINRFVDAGGSEEETVYLLPNAFPVRFFESGDLLNLHHKWKIRTCYNAQEEIFKSSVDELSQVREVHPSIGKWIHAPCRIRKEAGVRPFCPEGDRYCGVPVWGQELSEYERVI